MPIKSLEDEIECYNKILQISDNGFSKFWHDNQYKLPRLAKLVTSVCCGTAATLDSERDISISTDLITPKRNRLSDQNVTYLSFLKRNMVEDFSIPKKNFGAEFLNAKFTI